MGKEHSWGLVWKVGLWRSFIEFWLAPKLMDIARRRPVDVVISNMAGQENQYDVDIDRTREAYLLRWWLVPRNRFMNVYLHCQLRDDHDRCLHDHPWMNLSLILKGGYIEHFEWPGETYIYRPPGKIIFRRARTLHRLSLPLIQRQGHDYLSWSLFITGPKTRDWGFKTPKGWMVWHEYLGVENPPKHRL